jgi:elongation factor Ts
VVVKFGADKPGVFAGQEAKDFAFSLALHIAAFNPLALSREKLDPAYVKEQEDIFRAQMEGDEKFAKLKEAKPEQFNGILKGKLNKLLSEICLLEQGYVKDEKIPVSKALEEWGKKIGAKVNVTGYIYFKVGQ